MEFEMLNELVENGYDGEDLDELFEFCVDYIVEYEELTERSAQKRLFNKLKNLERKGTVSAHKKLRQLEKGLKDPKAQQKASGNIAARMISRAKKQGRESIASGDYIRMGRNTKYGLPSNFR